MPSFTVSDFTDFWKKITERQILMPISSPIF
jgi:hypothetical protein